MGLSIGQIANSLGAAATRAVNPPQPAVDQSNRAAADDGASLIRTDTPARPTAGFGPGTFSLQGAALNTINNTVEGARQTIPSLEEIRARFQLQAAADRAAFTESQFREPASLSGEVRTVESRIPEAAPQAARFQEAGLAAPAESAVAVQAEPAQAASVEPAVANAVPANEVAAADLSVPTPETAAVPDTAPPAAVVAPARESVATQSQPEPAQTQPATETPEPNRPATPLNVLA